MTQGRSRCERTDVNDQLVYKQLTIDTNWGRQVKLHFARVKYGLRLGHLVSIWMPHVSSASTINAQAVLGTSLVTSIFPERDRTCYLMIQDEAERSDLYRPSTVNGNGSPPMPDLITLRGYIDGGHEVEVAKVLVCVKSIGTVKSCKCLAPGSRMTSTLPRRARHSGSRGSTFQQSDMECDTARG